MSNNKEDDPVHLDRDISKPEPRMKKKIKKKIIIKKEKTEIKNSKKEEDNNINEKNVNNDKNEKDDNNVDKIDKIDKAISRQNSLINEDKDNKFENASVEINEPLKIKKQKENNSEDEENEEESEEEDDEDEEEHNKEDKNKDAHKMKEHIQEDPNIKYLKENLKPEYVEKKIQCDMDKETINQLLNEHFEELKKKENEYQAKVAELKSNFDLREQELVEQVEKLKYDLDFEIKTKIESFSKLEKEKVHKDKIISTLSSTNEKLRKNLTQLSEQVETLFNQLTSTKKILSKKEKNEKETSNKENLIKSKEKELKNAMTLVQILSKDNAKLKKELDNYGEYSVKLNLQDKIKLKDEEIAKLNFEIKLLKKEKDPNEINSQNENEIVTLKNEITQLRKDIQVHKESNRLLRQRCDLYQKGSRENSNKKLASSSSAINIKTKNITPIVTRFKQKDNSANTSLLLPTAATKSFYSLFNDEERACLLKLFKTKENFDLFNKKITVLESYRNSNDNLMKSSMKQLQNLLASKEEQIEYLSLKCKENEMKLRISHNTMNEGKNTVKIYQRRNNEMQNFIDDLLKNIQTQEEQIKILHEKISIMEHNKQITEQVKKKQIDLDEIINNDKKVVENKKNNEIRKIEKIQSNNNSISYKKIENDPINKEEKSKSVINQNKNDNQEKEQNKEEIVDNLIPTKEILVLNNEPNNVEIDEISIKPQKRKIVKKKVEKRTENGGVKSGQIKCEKLKQIESII